MVGNTGSMTRKEFVRKAVVGAAAVGAVAMGMSGKARAALPGTQATNPDRDNIDDNTPNYFEVYPTGNGPKTGTLTATIGSSYGDGNSFTITDGVHTPVTFYIKKSGTVRSGIPITVTQTSTPIQVGLAIANAINGVSRNLLCVNALSEVKDGRVYLSYDFTSDTSSNGNGIDLADLTAVPPSVGKFPVAWSDPVHHWDQSYTSNDVRNVQWAINNVAQGGTVILKKQTAGGSPEVFDFGTIGRIYIGKDLALQGESDGDRQERDPSFGYGGWILAGTTIFGGASMVISVGNITGQPNPGRSYGIQPIFAIKDIIFDSPRRMAIRVYACWGESEISGCNFRKVMRGLAHDGSPAGAHTVIIHGAVGAPTERSINGLTGTLRVKDNRFGFVVDTDGTKGNGFNSIMHYSCCNLDLRVSGNEVEDCVWGGFFIFANKGHTVISGNKVTKTRSFTNEGAAISVGLFPNNSLFITNYSYDGSTEIDNNDITIGSPPPAPGQAPDGLSTVNSWGIVLGNYPASGFPSAPDYPRQVPSPPPAFRVSGNSITMHRNYASNLLNPAAIRLLSAANNVSVMANSIAGEAKCGIELTRAPPAFMVPAFPDSHISDNLFSGNDLGEFRAAIAQVSLDPFSGSNYFGMDEENGLSGNTFGQLDSSGIAGVIDKGFSNNFVMNDFTVSGIMGKKSGNQVCLLLTEESHDNLVFQSGTFPPNTGGAKDQVSDLGTDNRVVGHPADLVADSKDRGIGQRLKDLEAQQSQTAPPTLVWDEAQGCYVDENGNCVQLS